MTITIERGNCEEAKAQFATIEASLQKAFRELGSPIVPLSGNERMQVLYDYYHLGDEESFDFDIREAKQTGTDFRNDLCNGMLKYYSDYFQDENKVGRALFIKKYPSGLSDGFLNEIASLPVHSMISLSLIHIYHDGSGASECRTDSDCQTKGSGQGEKPSGKTETPFSGTV